MKTKKIFSILMLLSMFFMLFINVNHIEADATANIVIKDNKVVLESEFATQDDAFSHIIEKYKTLITFFSAMAAITMVGIFIFNFTKLGATAGNPMERQKCITGLIISGIAASLLGSVALFTGLFYSMFRD